MPRPAEYEGPRVDTKVRLRPDHARLLREAQDDRGVGRNRLIEIALDQFFGIRATSPKLKRPRADAPIQGATPKQTRTRPRLAQPGREFEQASEAAQGGRVSP